MSLKTSGERIRNRQVRAAVIPTYRQYPKQRMFSGGRVGCVSLAGSKRISSRCLLRLLRGAAPNLLPRSALSTRGGGGGGTGRPAKRCCRSSRCLSSIHLRVSTGTLSYSLNNRDDVSYLATEAKERHRCCTSCRERLFLSRSHDGTLCRNWYGTNFTPMAAIAAAISFTRPK